MSYTCPRCGAVSHHPRDAAELYCGCCHAFEIPGLQTYILDDAGNPIREPNLLKWGKWMVESRDQRRLARDTIGDITVSTVFLGQDNSLGLDDGPPVLWETMILAGKLNRRQEHYTSRDAAIVGHRHAVWLAENPDAVETDE